MVQKRVDGHISWPESLERWKHCGWGREPVVQSTDPRGPRLTEVGETLSHGNRQSPGQTRTEPGRARGWLGDRKDGQGAHKGAATKAVHGVGVNVTRRHHTCAACLYFTKSQYRRLRGLHESSLDTAICFTTTKDVTQVFASRVVQCTTHTAVECGHDYSTMITSTGPKAGLSGWRPARPAASQRRFSVLWLPRLLVCTTQKAGMAEAPGSPGGPREDGAGRGAQLGPGCYHITAPPAAGA